VAYLLPMKARVSNGLSESTALEVSH